MNTKEAAIIIPVYKDTLSGTEKISLDQCCRILSSYDIIFVKPESLDIQSILADICDRFPKVRVRSESFSDSFFKGIEGYNRLMLSKELYRRFVGYTYILVYQLDAFVFRDELHEWCAKGYDFIGAPWIPMSRHRLKPLNIIKTSFAFTFFRFFAKDRLTLSGTHAGKEVIDHSKYCCFQVGNGGLSLRKTSRFLEITTKNREKIDRLTAPGKAFYPEDLLLRLEIGQRLRRPGFRQALKFSLEENPAWGIRQTGDRLPFGCHGWPKAEYSDFWKDYILFPDTPMVSVIVPNYNYAAFLPERMDSIFGQTFKDYEVILLDDASTDGSAELLDRYSRRPEVSATIINKTNTGIPFLQWKKGIENARGRYIWIAEADDSARPEFLETAVRLLESDGAVLFFSGCVMAGPDGKSTGEDIDSWAKPAFKTPDGTYLFDGKFFSGHYLIWRNYIYNASGAVFRKSAVPENWDNVLKFRYCGDWYFWSEVVSAGKVVITGEKLNIFRQHRKSTTLKSIHSGDGVVESMRAINCTTRKIPLLKRLVRIGMLYRDQRRGCNDYSGITTETFNTEYFRIFGNMTGRIGIFAERMNRLAKWMPWYVSLNKDRSDNKHCCR